MKLPNQNPRRPYQAQPDAHEQAEIERYIKSYREQPQTEEEFGWLDYVTLQAFGELPWEQEEE